MSAYTLTVRDCDRRRRRPLAEHTDLTADDARELQQVYFALGHRPENVSTTHDAEEQAA